MKLIALLTRLTMQALRRRPAATGAVQPVAEEGLAEADERPLGCGWFDSSHELQTGLLVQEHSSAEALAAELPLAQWLEMQLGSWRVMRPA
jgi:hypothetical protein